MSEDSENDALIKVTGVSKRFCRRQRLAVRYGMVDSVRDLLLPGRDAPQLRPQEFWAVDDVSFEVKRGECLGIVGHNGAGKSTLLKMLNGIYPPDRGRIQMKGTIGPLLEIGAGFHPQLTGRENVFVAGALLGLPERQIKAVYEEIVDFAGLRDFMDTPVGYFSSGMFVRLGFAIYAQLKPDVLLMDEVLAVGDLAFRAKCYEVITRLLPRCAVVFISHNPMAVARVSTRVMMMNHGAVAAHGDVNDVLAHYIGSFPSATGKGAETLANSVECRELKVNGEVSPAVVEIEALGPCEWEFELSSAEALPRADVVLEVHAGSGEVVAEWNGGLLGEHIQLPKGISRWRLALPKVALHAGRYDVTLLVVGQHRLDHRLWLPRVLTLAVNDTGFGATGPHKMEGTLSAV